VSAEVEAPPIDCTVVFGPEDEGYCYFQGAFFIYDESADQYVVVEPPAGTSVTHLPPGYEEVTVAGTEYMKLGGTYYRPYYEGDEVTIRCIGGLIRSNTDSASGSCRARWQVSGRIACIAGKPRYHQCRTFEK